ncbi:MAG: aminotransferase class IV [Desulfobacteraceae bacterium]|jgi:branched-chain amino acid aminotransferase
MDVYYIDGNFVEDDKASISVKDIAVLRGFGVFDFLITYNSRPFKLQEHVARLENSARNIGLSIHRTNAEICSIVEETVRRNAHHDESNVRIVYTGGISSDGVTPEGNGKLMVLVTPKHVLPEWWYTRGAKIITVEIERFLPDAKSTSYLSAVYALQLANKADAIEAVYVDRNQRVLEGTTSNFFFFKGDKLITAGKDILPGITRSVILELVKGRFEVEIRDIDRSELTDMSEAFITASNKEVVPVIQVDDLFVNGGKPGEKTKEIMRLFRETTTAYGQGQA